MITNVDYQQGREQALKNLAIAKEQEQAKLKAKTHKWVTTNDSHNTHVLRWVRQDK